MDVHSKALRGLTVIAVIGVAGSACAHVSQEDLDGRLTTLREDLTTQIEQGDQQLARRVDDVEGRMAQLESDLNDLQQQYDVTIERLETALRFDVPVYFDFDDSAVKPEGHEVLERFSQIAQEYYPDALLTVEGFTDPAGSREYNLRLGQARAESVKDYLVQQGMPGDRIRTVSYGEDGQRLVADGAQGPGSDGWQNRRVVMVIDHSGQMQGAVASTGEPNR